jgi:Gpi18-like mannosyltransferase
MLYKTEYHWLLSLFGPLFFLFNRWTLHVVKVSEIDFLPLLILILALIGIKNGKSSSNLLFGLSLSIKQMGIFLVPLTAIWAWKDGRDSNNLATMVKKIGLVALIPTILILPFLVWDAEGFF